MDVNLRVILASCEPRIQEPAVPNASLIKSLSSSSSPLPGYNNEVATSSKVQTKNNKGMEYIFWPGRTVLTIIDRRF